MQLFLRILLDKTTQTSYLSLESLYFISLQFFFYQNWMIFPPDDPHWSEESKKGENRRFSPFFDSSVSIDRAAEKSPVSPGYKPPVAPIDEHGRRFYTDIIRWLQSPHTVPSFFRLAQTGLWNPRQ